MPSTSAHNPASPASRNWLVLLGLLTAVAPLSIDMYLPSFPEVQRALGARAGSMELTLSAFFVGLTLGQLAYGPLSDRFGRKIPLLCGFALFVVASMGCATADSVLSLEVWRFIQGVGGCSGIIIPNAIVRDRTTGRDGARAFSMLILVMGVAPILAPMIGGMILSASTWRMIFWVLAAFGIACFVAVLFKLPETRPPANQPPLRLENILSGYADLLKNRVFMGFALSGSLVMAGMFAYIAGSPYVLINIYGVDPRQYGVYFGANAVGLVLASQINGRQLQKNPPTEMLRHALWIPPIAGIALTVLACTGVMSLSWFMVFTFLFMASIGWIMPNAMASALSTHGLSAGSAAALVGAVQYFLATVAGVLVGVFHTGTAIPLATVMGICGCAAWVAHRVLISSVPTLSHQDVVSQ